MLDVAWPELVVVGVVALVAIGPKELPKAMYALGRMAGKARVFFREMRLTFDQLTLEAEQSTRSKPEPKPSDKAPR